MNFSAFCLAIFGGRHTVLSIKLKIEITYAVKAAINAYAGDTVIGGHQHLRGVLHAQSVDELRETATEHLIEPLGNVRIIVPEFPRYGAQTDILVVILLDILEQFFFKIFPSGYPPPPFFSPMRTNPDAAREQI